MSNDIYNLGITLEELAVKVMETERQLKECLREVRAENKVTAYEVRRLKSEFDDRLSGMVRKEMHFWENTRCAERRASCSWCETIIYMALVAAIAAMIKFI